LIQRAFGEKVLMKKKSLFHKIKDFVYSFVLTLGKAGFGGVAQNNKKPDWSTNDTQFFKRIKDPKSE